MAQRVHRRGRIILANISKVALARITERMGGGGGSSRAGVDECAKIPRTTATRCSRGLLRLLVVVMVDTLVRVWSRQACIMAAVVGYHQSKVN